MSWWDAVTGIVEQIIPSQVESANGWYENVVEEFERTTGIEGATEFVENTITEHLPIIPHEWVIDLDRD